jgi:hypothetical protein
MSLPGSSHWNVGHNNTLTTLLFRRLVCDMEHAHIWIHSVHATGPLADAGDDETQLGASFLETEKHPGAQGIWYQCGGEASAMQYQQAVPEEG